MTKEIINHLGERAVLIVDGTGGKVVLEGFFQQSMKNGRAFDFIQVINDRNAEAEVSPFVPGRKSPKNPVLKRYLFVFPDQIRHLEHSGSVPVYRVSRKGIPCKMVDYVGESETIFGIYTPAIQKAGFSFEKAGAK